MRAQIAWSDVIKGQVWREIVCEKIRKQADFLSELHKDREAELLYSYVIQVEPRDETNREGHAAKVYFNALFGMGFTRGADTPINASLNYGYSLLLSSFNRCISANGYLTQLGVFHDNMFNHYNLGSDLMEPFRIIIDRYVYRVNPRQLDKEEKHALWKLLEQEIAINQTRQILSNANNIYSKSVFDALNSGDVSLLLFYSLEG